MGRLTIQEAIEQIEDLEGFVFSETGSLPNDNDMEALEILKEAAIELQHYKELEEQGLLIEQKHGHWIRHGYKWRCSECDEKINIDGTPLENGLYYCPHCGAKMDEVEE